MKVVAPVTLPAALSTEPSVAVTNEGVITVAAPASSGSNPTVMTHGGYVWVSHNGGGSFDLVVNPKDPDVGGGCSCDTDVVAIGRTLYASTMYWQVNPLFNANVIASRDGVEWEVRSPIAAQQGPIDRHWLSEGPRGELLLTYHRTYGFDSILMDEAGQPASLPVYLQKSMDGGRTWSPATVVANPTDGNRKYYSMKPVSVPPSSILVPLQRATLEPELRGTMENFVAVSRDGGETFSLVNLASPYPEFAAFSLSIDATPDGRVVAAWSAPDNLSGTSRIHLRQSMDAGETWGPTRVLPIQGSALQPWVALRDDGVLAVAFYGTIAEAPILELEDDAAWFPRVGLFTGEEADLVGVANLSTHPVYEGMLCNGPMCPSGADRSPLREFLSAEWGPSENLFVAFTDVSGNPDPEGRHGRIAVTKVVVDAAQPGVGSPPNPSPHGPGTPDPAHGVD